MRAKISAAVVAAALLSSAALAQRVPVGAVSAKPIGTVPVLEEIIDGHAIATRPLSITHISAAGVEQGAEPAGTVFTTTPRGPACPHWPLYGCGAHFSAFRAEHGFDYRYLSRDMVQVSPGELGDIGPHENLIVARATERLPCFVDVRIHSVVESDFSYKVAEVEVVGYGVVRHVFAPGAVETVESVPAELSPEGLHVRVKTRVFVNNSLVLVARALVDLEVGVTVRLPAASYTIEGAVSCAGSNGPPFLSRWGGDLPVLGSTFSVAAMNLPLSPAKPAFGLIGGSRFLPFDLSLIGMPNCFLHISSPVAVPLEKCCGAAEWSLYIPMNTNLLGAEFYQQVFALDESYVNPLGAVITNYGHGVIGAPPSVY